MEPKRKKCNLGMQKEGLEEDRKNMIHCKRCEKNERSKQKISFKNHTETVQKLLFLC